MEPEIAIQRSRTKPLVIAAVSAFFATGAVVVGMEGRVGSRLLLYACAALFGIAGVIAVSEIFRRGPGLVIDDDGFADRTTHVSVGRVAWADVSGLRVFSVGSIDSVVVMVRNPEAYIARLSPTKGRIARRSLAMVGSPVAVSPAALQIDIDELHLLLRDGFERHSGSLGVVPPIR